MAKKATKAMVSAPTAPAEEAAPVAEVIPVRPIWKDSFYQFTSTSPVDYTLRINGKVAYSGHAVPRPDGSARIKLNGIVANYLGQMFPTMPMSGDRATAFVEIDEGNTGAFVGVARFIYDWSYKNGYTPYRGIVSEPIDGKASPWQSLLFTSWNIESLSCVLIDVNGVATTVTKSGEADKITNHFIYDLTDDIRKVIINNVITYEVTDGCENFCLYYVNAHGGWDSLLIPRGKRTDTINRHTYRKEYDNRTEVEAGVVDYANDVTRKYELHTALLSGEAGKRMHHLLESPLVYLQDLKDGKLYPVIILNSECEEKSFKSEGGHLFMYTINVEVARDYKRK